MSENIKEITAPPKEHRNDSRPFQPWKAEADNHDPHQDPCRVIPYLMGV